MDAASRLVGIGSGPLEWSLDVLATFRASFVDPERFPARGVLLRGAHVSFRLGPYSSRGNDHHDSPENQYRE